MSRMACTDTPLALGWTLNTIALPAEIPAMVLLMIVAVGLVVGVMAPITPNGAGSVRVRPRSPVQGAGGLVDDQQVLLDLVLGAAETGFCARHFGE